MSRSRQITAGVLSLGLLLGLLGGVPYLLVVYVGWPLPHGVPTWSQFFTTALGTRGIPDQTLLKTLAIAIWFAWASLTAALLAEIVAVARGNTSRRLPLAGLLQPLAAQLLAAVLIGVLALGRPMPSPSLSLPSVATPSVPAAAVLIADVTHTTPTTNGSAASSVPTTTTYVVRPDDTLWGIAAARLGDAERWEEILELNRGRPQADGRSLTDPHWIYAGWVLVLPAMAHPTTSPTAPSKPDASHKSPAGRVPNPTVPTMPAPSPIGATGPVANGAAPGSAHSSAHVGVRGGERQPVDQMPQRLPSGSLVGASFVATVLALLALGRRRRRHAYRYRPPEPGRDLGGVPLGPTLRALRQRATPDEQDDEDVVPTEGDLVTPVPVQEADADFLEVGVEDDRPIQLDRHQLSLLSLDGAGAEDVARYLLNALLVEHGHGAVELVAERSVLDAFAPGAAELPAARVTDSQEAVVRALETELLARSRRLADNDLPDIDAYRSSHPEDPIPTIAALLATPDLALGARLAEIAKSGPLLDLMIVNLDETKLGSHLSISADHRVVSATSESLQIDVEDAECFALGTDEASEICRTLADAEPDEEPEDVSSVTELTEEGERYDESWPEVAVTKSPHSVEVRMLGAYRLFAHGKEINRGRRRAAKELLAWYALRPEGATAEAAVDAIWPETAPDHVSKRFWLALGDLRTLCRDPNGESHVEVLVKRGERYAIDVEAVSIDVWEFQARLSDTAKASDPEHQLQALRSAVDAYRGDFAEDEDYLWIEPAREDFHRRALDADLRLAELEEELDAPERAVEVLERTIALDHYAEEPYRRAMQLLARLERFDAVDATWRSLQAALSDLNIEPDRETLAIYRTLSSMRESVRAASN